MVDSKASHATVQIVNDPEEVRRCQWLVLWLDCDREEENIAFEDWFNKAFGG